MALFLEMLLSCDETAVAQMKHADEGIKIDFEQLLVLSFWKQHFIL